MNEEIKYLMVSGSSPVKELAGSVVKCYEGGDRNIELRAIGASSVNQMYKALATARSIFAQKGLDLLIRAGYSEAEIKGDKKTVMIARIVLQ
nr:MAG TPA: Stage V sporulation protein S (SpoVS) [Caudoviricetes sp.]